MITHAQLLELVHYDSDTGSFTLRNDGPRLKAGTVLNRNHLIPPYRTPQSHIYIPGHPDVLAGRLAWFYVTGEWPLKEIDHRDRNGWNQKWSNLRPSTRSQNQANTKRYRSNSSGMKCVFPSGNKGRPWRAQIQKDKRRISLGRFETREAAFSAYMEAAKAHHGEYANFY